MHLAALVLAAASCTRDVQPDPPASSDQFRAVPISLVQDTLSTPATAPAPNLVLGSGAHGENDIFGYVADVAVDSRGFIHVLDLFLDQVKTFDAAGHFVRVLADKGNGPSELRNPRMMTLGGDTVFVSGERLQAFDTAGQLLSSVDPGGGYFLFASSLDYSSHGLMSARWTRAPDDRSFRDDTLVVSRFTAGSMVPVMGLVQRRFAFSKSNHNPRMLSAGVLLSIVRDGAMYVVPGDTFDIEMRDWDGTLTRRIQAHVERVPATDQDLDDHANSESLLAKAVARVDVDFHDTYANGPRAEFRPAIGAMLPLDPENVLIKRPDRSDRPYDRYTPGHQVEWDVLNLSSGTTRRYLLPAGFAPRVYHNCMIYGRADGTDDVPVVLRFQVGPPDSCD